MGEQFHPSAQWGTVRARRGASEGCRRQIHILYRIAQVGAGVDNATGLPRAPEGRPKHGERGGDWLQTLMEGLQGSVEGTNSQYQAFLKSRTSSTQNVNTVFGVILLMSIIEY